MHRTAVALGFVCAGLGAAITVGCSSSSDAPTPDQPDFDSGRRDSGAFDAALDSDFQGDTAPPGPICAASPCAIQIALGGRHSCALLVDGTVRCWGLNVKGQLGSGGLADGGFSATSQSKPVAVAPLSGASQISANGHTSTFHQTCALANGAISCWGDANQGHLGGGDAGARMFSTASAAPMAAASRARRAPFNFLHRARLSTSPRGSSTAVRSSRITRSAAGASTHPDSSRVQTRDRAAPFRPSSRGSPA